MKKRMNMKNRNCHVNPFWHTEKNCYVNFLQIYDVARVIKYLWKISVWVECKP